MSKICILISSDLLDEGRIANYDMTVNFANNERAKRPNYRAVREHDGLTWQQSQEEVWWLYMSSNFCACFFYQLIY